MKARIRKHRDGGFIFEVFADTWAFDAVWARRRKNRWGVLAPFCAELRRYPR